MHGGVSVVFTQTYWAVLSLLINAVWFMASVDSTAVRKWVVTSPRIVLQRCHLGTLCLFTELSGQSVMFVHNCAGVDFQIRCV